MSTTALGTRISYWRTDSGNADKLLVLHGLAADHAGILEMAMSGIEAVDIIAPDLPGHGMSEPLRTEHTLANYADAIEEFRTRLGLEEFHLVGHSLGATIALVYAARYGSALRTLSLLNPVTVTGGVTGTLTKFYYRTGARLPPGLGRLWLTSRPAVYLSNSMIMRTRNRIRRRIIMRQDYRTYRCVSTRALIETALSYTRTPLLELAGKVSAQTLLVAGGKDGIARPSAVARLHDVMGSSRLTVLGDAGHLVPVEEPAEIASVLNEFLAPRLATRAAALSTHNVETSAPHSRS
jgi:pimeloyl-ACP methyl ester carboxylesterase